MTHPISTPLLGLMVAVFVLIFLLIRTKVHPLIAMIGAACIAGLTGGLTVDATLDAITKGFGSTLGTIGIIIGLGVMMGRILEVSGAAEQIAYSFIRWMGRRREEWALALTGYFVSIPIFADSAFVILYPIAKALAITGKRSLRTMGVALAGGLIVTHTIVPPTPGPLGVAGLFGVNVGTMMLLGIALGIPCTISFILYAQWVGKKYPDPEQPEKEISDALPDSLAVPPDKPLPSLGLSLLPIVIPILLILLKAVVQMAGTFITPDSTILSGVFEVINFTGAPIIALCVGTLIAVYSLVPYLDRRQTSARLEEGLQAAGIILMVTGAGGALGYVVRESGVGTQLADQISRLPFSAVMIPFLVSTVIRFVQGSATVAMITAASITAPLLAEVPDVNMLFAAQAAVTGSFFFSYFNDSLFWIVNRLLGVVQVKEQIMTWSIPTTIAWAVGGLLIALLNLAFGADGKWPDVVIPLSGLVIIFWVMKRK